MPSLWKFGSLSPIVLTQRAIKKLGDDELSTRSAALSYYFILALFPMFLFLMSLIGLFAGPGSELRETILSALGRMAPGAASGLVHGVVVVGLTVALAALIISALILVLYAGKIGQTLATYVGLGDVFKVAWEILHWPLSFGAMFMSFSVIYYFGPNVRGKWHWVTPGAALGVALWLVASLGFRMYLKFFNSYTATYGSLGAVIILLLWLYITGAAVLLGAELNSIIEEEDKNTALQASKKLKLEQQLKLRRDNSARDKRSRIVSSG